MIYSLFIWTVVAMGHGTTARDWKQLAQFETLAQCQEAVRSMNLQDRHRCLKIKG